MRRRVSRITRREGGASGGAGPSTRASGREREVEVKHCWRKEEEKKKDKKKRRRRRRRRRV